MSSLSVLDQSKDFILILVNLVMG